MWPLYWICCEHCTQVIWAQPNRPRSRPCRQALLLSWRGKDHHFHVRPIHRSLWRNVVDRPGRFGLGGSTQKSSADETADKTRRMAERQDAKTKEKYSPLRKGDPCGVGQRAQIYHDVFEQVGSRGLYPSQPCKDSTKLAEMGRQGSQSSGQTPRG